MLAGRVIVADPEMVHRFLGDAAVDEPPAWNPDGVNETPLRTIMFTDIVGSTDAANRLGDDAAMDSIAPWLCSVSRSRFGERLARAARR